MGDLLIVFGILALLFTNKLPAAVAGVMNFDPLYKKWGQAYGVDWRLLKAIAKAESSENPIAKNPADPSYGLMQILYPQKLPAVENWPPESVEALYDPDYNVSVGAQIIGWNVTTYGLKRGIAVYNRWDSRLDPENGPFGNQAYVDRVWAYYVELGGSDGTAGG